MRRRQLDYCSGMTGARPLHFDDHEFIAVARRGDPNQVIKFAARSKVGPAAMLKRTLESRHDAADLRMQIGATVTAAARKLRLRQLIAMIVGVPVLIVLIVNTPANESYLIYGPLLIALARTVAYRHWWSG